MIPPKFVILTAYNPRSIVCSDEQNQRAMITLQSKLYKRGVEFDAIVGCSPDLSYQEPSFIVNETGPTITELCIEFAQNAYFEVVEDELSLTPVLLSDQDTVRLGSFRQRISFVDSGTP